MMFLNVFDLIWKLFNLVLFVKSFDLDLSGKMQVFW